MLSISLSLSLSVFLSGMTLARSRSVVGRAQIDPSILVKNAHASWTPWSTKQKVGSCGHVLCPLLGSALRETGTHVLTPWSMFRDSTEKLAHMLDNVYVSGNSNDGQHQKLVFCLSLSGSLGLVVRIWAREVRGVVFHTRRRTQR